MFFLAWTRAGLLVAVLLCFDGASCQSSKRNRGSETYQVLQAFSQCDQLGEQTIINEHIPDLARINWDNYIQSVCAWGVWLFFEDPNYNGNTWDSARVEWVFGEGHCTNLATEFVRGRVRSLKYVGDIEDWFRDTITFFQHKLFMGTEYYEVTDVADTRVWSRPKSLIITGDSSWSLYERVYFGGFCVCIEPMRTYRGGIAIVEDLVSATDLNGVGSFRKGCRSECDGVYRANLEDHGRDYGQRRSRGRSGRRRS
ncbi:unnamed protein product [Cyprideis torosa]|uniref:Uncharacterized protein n=1 Tax=Cyprideis torosa TaxID=163714 RepID=A0A7R8ZN06_9CRUS|nr:unnamed protein product [Cyprideis torosa]CAG0896828.1 unnamed protein product [Cyprideis torosa]